MILKVVFFIFSQDKSQPKMKGNSLQIEITYFGFHLAFMDFFKAYM
jgi:hypothetical protein